MLYLGTRVTNNFQNPGMNNKIEDRIVKGSYERVGTCGRGEGKGRKKGG
jgi:hypothetical protein